MASSPLHHRPSPRRPTVGRGPSGADRGGAPPPRPPRPPWSPESQDEPARPDRRPGGFSPTGPGRPPPRRRRILRLVWAAAALAVVGLAAFWMGRSLWNDRAPSVVATEEAVESDSRSAPSRSEPTATQEPEPESSSEPPMSQPEPSPSAPESSSADPPQRSEAESLAEEPSAQTGADWGEMALSIVLVSAYDCEREGSGSVVGDGGYVLTNAHVVHDYYGSQCSELGVWFTDSFDQEPAEWVPAQLVGADPVHDLALLRLTGRPAWARKPVEIVPRQLDPGELITVLGYPGVGGLRMTLTQGVYSGVDNGDYIKTDADLAEGNSGGAAFDSSGAFVGVPTAVVGEVGLVIPAAAAERFLQRTLTAS